MASGLFKSSKIGAKERHRGTKNILKFNVESKFWSNKESLICCFGGSIRQQWKFGFKSGEFIMELDGVEEDVEGELNMSRTPDVV